MITVVKSKKPAVKSKKVVREAVEVTQADPVITAEEVWGEELIARAKDMKDDGATLRATKDLLEFILAGKDRGELVARMNAMTIFMTSGIDRMVCSGRMANMGGVK